MRWAWPLPAVFVWLGAWGWYAGLLAFGLSQAVSFAVAASLGMLASLWGDSRWRRVWIGLGFPLSWVLLHGAADMPAWVWLLPAGVFLLLYPPVAWRDAPLFPTPPDALEGLREQVPLPPMARILDAGAGMGDGLRALERAYPDARLEGVERSWPLVQLARWRCPGARVFRGDMWRSDWSAYDMVYLFQRPETMPRAAEKARRELRPGAWLVSLEFEAPGLEPVVQLESRAGKLVWVYAPAAGARDQR
ncbi:class I SAM-dependent methyltransferase [Tepidicella baoligensis]|uniref:class I SAM-dependent methyltransferase n=1 Tax=Tepidicella baoligensis TaxID=2707016 RepID=UPI0015DBA256|nr:class I SAM-dependent methyltransferase [Tepidicella baoligensis]